MMVRVNGEETEVPEESSVEDLVRILGHRSDRVAVEIDGEICPRADRSARRLAPGQRVEVVSFVGGG